MESSENLPLPPEFENQQVENVFKSSAEFCYVCSLAANSKTDTHADIPNGDPVGDPPPDAVAAERAARRQAVVNPILEKKRWKPGRLVTESGVGKATVYGYLDGTRSWIDKDNRKAIAQCLDLKPEELPD